jgi:hypothetical protein
MAGQGNYHGRGRERLPDPLKPRHAHTALNKRKTLMTKEELFDKVAQMTPDKQRLYYGSLKHLCPTGKLKPKLPAAMEKLVTAAYDLFIAWSQPWYAGVLAQEHKNRELARKTVCATGRCN